MVDQVYNITPDNTPAPYNISNTQQPPVSEEAASHTALNAQYALAPYMDADYDKFKYTIQSGQEQSLRQEASSTIDKQRYTDLQETIKNRLSTIVDPKLQLETTSNLINNFKPTDPNAVLENTLAHRYTSNVYNLNLPEGVRYQWLQEATQKLPKFVQSAIDLANDNSSAYFFSQHQEQQAKNQYENQGWSPYLKETALELVTQLYPETLRGTLDGDKFWAGLLGSSLEAKRQSLYSLSFKNPAAYRQEYQKTMDDLYEAGAYDLARVFAKAMSGQTQNEQQMHNVFSALAPLDLLGLSFVRKTLGLGTNLVKGAVGFETRAPRVAAAAGTGDLTQSAIEQSTLNTLGQVSGNFDPAKNAVQSLTTHLNLFVKEARANPGNYGQEIVNRIQDLMDSGNIIEALNTWQRVNRTPVAVASEQVNRLVKDYLKDQWKGPDNAVLNIMDPVHDRISNTYVYEHIIGTPNGEYFKDLETAQGAAKQYGLVLAENGKEGYAIRNDNSGAGFYIGYDRHLPEHFDGVRENLITRDQFRNPMSIQEYMDMVRSGEISTGVPANRMGNWMEGVIGKYRTPVETLPKEEVAARNLATFGPGRLVKLAEEIGSPIAKMPKQYHDQFERFLVAGQYKTDPATGLPGYRFRSPADIEKQYSLMFGRMPDKSEIEAYYSYVKLNEFDRMIRETLNYRNKAIAGVEQHQFSVKGADGKTDVKSGFFEGIRQNKLPGGHDSLVVLGKKLGAETWALGDHLGESINAKALGQLKQDIEDGKKYVLRLWDPESFPLRHLGGTFSDKRVRYVIMDSYETKPLSWSSIPSRGGGHLVPDYDYYLKQPIIHREVTRKGNKVIGINDWYHGDRTVMPIDIRAKGEEIAKGMNAVRQALQKGDEAGARQLHLDHQLPFDVDQHIGWYKSGRDPNGNELSPRLNKDHDIQVVPKDKTIVDMSNDLKEHPNFKYTDKDGKTQTSFRDGTKSGSDARMAQIEFTGQRDAYEIYTVGDGGLGNMRNPLYNWQVGKYVDPISAMDRGLGRIINSVFMDDYKLYAMEHTLQQMRPYLRKDFWEEMRSAPFASWAKLDEGAFLPGLAREYPEIQSIMLANLKKTKDFIGVASARESFAMSLAQKMADSLWTAGYGSKAGVAIVDTMKLPFIKNPIQLLRNLSVHYHLGMGNIQAFATQYTTILNIYGISPRHAVSATMGMYMHALSSVNRTEEGMRLFDNMASGLSKTAKYAMLGQQAAFKPGEWTESTRLMESIGFNNIGGEHAFLDTPLNVNLVKGVGTQALKLGLKPFEWGAQSTRIAAWHTAYLEARASKPVGAFSRREVSQILDRAAVLDHNMNKSAMSALQTGAMSPFSLFYGYSMRLTELMFGKQLTPMEKFRLISLNALAYGLPVGAGGFAAVPFADYIRGNMMRTGTPFSGNLGQSAGEVMGAEPYVPGQNLGTTMAMEGVITPLVAWLNGDIRDPKNYYNISRFGNKGVEGFNLAGDRSWWDSVVVASDLRNMGRAALPFIRYAGNLFYDDQEAKTTLTLQDVWNVGRIPSSGNKWAQVLHAYNTMDWAMKQGKWETRTGTVVGSPSDDTGVSAKEAILSLLTGVDKQEYGDVYVKNEWIKAKHEVEKNAEQQFIELYHRHLNNDDEGNKDEAMRNYLQAKAVLIRARYPMEKLGTLMDRATEGAYRSLVNKVDYDFYVKTAQPDEFDSLTKAYANKSKAR